MKAFLITAMQSGAGKTVMSCALMTALKKRGLEVSAFKAGPDYIDPMFHQRVLGVESRNLDLFLQGKEGVQRSFCAARGDVALVEGAMGYYDGLSGTTDASAWALGRELEIPAVLVLRSRGSGLTLAAQVRGMQTFRKSSGICALLFADCSERLSEYLTPILERECGIPVLGYLPHLPEAELESRHLGLLTAEEVQDFAERMDILAEQVNRTVNLDRLLSAAADVRVSEAALEKNVEEGFKRCRIAVARDEAFCFQYADNLDALRSAGAELRFFSPLQDHELPKCEGLYLCGGYPELYADRLSANRSMLADIAGKIRSGLPVVAECGGFLYLQQSLEDSGGAFRTMCGVLPGKGFRTEHLQRFGYLKLCAEKDSLLFRSGEKIPAHEFHYWDSTECGSDLHAMKAGGKSWNCGYAGKTMYAAFPHLHFGGELPLAERFVKACENHEKHS